MAMRPEFAAGTGFASYQTHHGGKRRETHKFVLEQAAGKQEIPPVFSTKNGGKVETHATAVGVQGRQLRYALR
jgi:hypothetical protein